MTGRGEGYCVLRLDRGGRVVGGYAGIRGRPIAPGRLARRALTALFRGRRPLPTVHDKEIE